MNTADWNNRKILTQANFAPSHSQSYSSFKALQSVNPLKEMQTQIAQTKRQQIVANRRKNFAEKKKTELCKHFLLGGSCPLGRRCSFAHGEDELKPKAFHNYKTVKCRHFHEKGFCQYGPRCQFLHNDRKGEIRNIKPEYSQWLRIMNDAFVVKAAEVDAGHCYQQQSFDESLINFEQSRIQKLQIFQSIRGEDEAYSTLNDF